MKTRAARSPGSGSTSDGARMICRHGINAGTVTRRAADVRTPQICAFRTPTTPSPSSPPRARPAEPRTAAASTRNGATSRRGGMKPAGPSPIGGTAAQDQRRPPAPGSREKPGRESRAASEAKSTTTRNPVPGPTMRSGSAKPPHGRLPSLDSRDDPPTKLSFSRSPRLAVQARRRMLLGRICRRLTGRIASRVPELHNPRPYLKSQTYDQTGTAFRHPTSGTRTSACLQRSSRSAGGRPTSKDVERSRFQSQRPGARHALAARAGELAGRLRGAGSTRGKQECDLRCWACPPLIRCEPSRLQRSGRARCVAAEQDCGAPSEPTESPLLSHKGAAQVRTRCYRRIACRMKYQRRPSSQRPRRKSTKPEKYLCWSSYIARWLPLGQ